MTFWTILWYLTSYLTSKYRLTPSKSQNVKILTSQSFFHPKKLTLRPTQSFYWDIWRFRWFWDHFGSFWGTVTSQRGQDFKILNFWNFKGFSTLKTYPYTFLDQNNDFIKSYCVFPFSLYKNFVRNSPISHIKLANPYSSK